MIETNTKTSIKNHKVMNEIIEILIKNNLSVSESTIILDGVSRRIRVQSVTDNCLFK